MSWICDYCETENSDDLLVCEVCGYASSQHHEEETWKNALQTDTEASYDSYIRKYPSGRHKIAAKRKLEALKAKRQERNRIKKRLAKLIGTIIAIIIIVIIVKNNSLTSHPTYIPPHSTENIGVKVTPKTNRAATSKGKNVEINHSEDSHNIESAKKSDNNVIDIEAIERRLEKKIKGMETAKENGDAVNPEILREAQSLLNEIESSSSKYSSFRNRINDLIQ